MLIVAAEHRLVTLALVVKNGMAEGRWINASIRRPQAIQNIIAELLADRASILKRRIDRVIRAAEHLDRPKCRLRAALRRNIDKRGRFISHIGFHPAQHNIARSQARGEITSENVVDTVSGIGTPSMRY